MCAISGILKLQVPDSTVQKMKATMRHRGPDGWGMYQKKDCTLLHSRLAIVDPEGGKQPMTLDWQKERYIIVYNGELYNTNEVKKELLQYGHTFLGHSDTEVVLHSYAQWGAECLQRLNGIFAFAVIEEKRERLFLARDRIGVKPLFYKLHESGLLFASEIKTILSYPTVKAELDREGANQLLLLGPGRIPGSGVLRGIRELEPGWCGYYEQGKLVVSQYWKLTDGEHREDFFETAEHVRALVKDAIERQMVSDFPIGTFLSGGLDSSIISAVCAARLLERGEHLNTFSLDYKNNAQYFVPGKFQPNSDADYIEIMQNAIQSDHHLTVLSAEDLSDALEPATIARDIPGMADVDYSLLLFCREIRKDVKVALSGECADEIFGGYPWYRDPEIRMKAGFPWAQTTSQRTALLSQKLKENFDGEAFVMDHYLSTCAQSDIQPDAAAEDRRIRELVNLNFRWFMQSLLDRKDRMSMACGLEVRVPFCDYRIAEYLYRVPWQYKDYGGKEKGLLRFAFQGFLPDRILWRKKSPYPKTFDPAYEKLMEERLKKILNAPSSPLFCLIDRNALIDFLNCEQQWPWYGQLMRRPQTMAYFASVDFWLREYCIDICL